MKLRIALLAILCLALALVPAWAQNWSYDNGPINGTTDAWTINFGYIVSDTYIAERQQCHRFQVRRLGVPGRYYELGGLVDHQR